VIVVEFASLARRTGYSIPSIRVVVLVYSALMNYGILAACKPIVSEILCDFDDRERAILNKRILAIGKKQTLQELAGQYSITRERARQVEKLIISRVKKRARSSLYKSLARAVRHLKDAIGTACPTEYVFSHGIMKDDQAGSKMPADLVLRVILWLAGPYEEYRAWLVRAPAIGTIKLTKKIVRRMARREPANLEAVMASVVEIPEHKSIS
jgi:hypothetical protein